MLHKIKQSIRRHVAWFASKHPVAVVKLRYLLRFHRLPDLKHPQDLNEKILYLKLFTDTSEWTTLADKYKVRDYVGNCGLGEYLIPLIGAWDNVEDISFDKLRTKGKIMFKANNGDGRGTNKIVDMSSVTDKEVMKLRKLFSSWLNAKNIGALSAEPQYKDIPPKILAEEVIQTDKGYSSLVDYKIWCFNGKPYSILTCSNRDGEKVELNCYDLDWHAHPEEMVPSHKFPISDKPLPKPMQLDKMLQIAEILSRPFPEVRVDLYQSDNKVYFGELTFTSLGGMMNYYTEEYLLEMGKQCPIQPNL